MGTNTIGETRFNTDQIPDIELKLLAEVVLTEVKRYFEIPENAARFEEWKKEKRA